MRPQLSKIVLFFKNVDLCFTDEWGTCEAIELIIELIQRNGFYNDDLEWIRVSGLIVCCSMTSSPVDSISPRYLSIAVNFYTEYPDDGELNLIIRNHFSPIAAKFELDARPNKVNQIVESLIAVYQNVSD